MARRETEEAVHPRASRALAAVLLIAMLLPAATAAADAPSVDPGGGQPEPAPFVTFSPNVRVNSGNPTYAYQVEPTMKVNSQGRIFVGWKEAPTHNGGGYRVGFSTSEDGGATWSPNVLMPLVAASRQSDPWLTITPDDRVHFTRLEFDSLSTTSGISVSNTTDGVSWGTTHFYDDGPNFADKETAAHDAAGNLYWVWNTDDLARNAYDLVFARSDDGGATWTSKVYVPDTRNGALGGFVLVHPNGTVLATWWSWMTDNVWFDRSFDGGLTWGSDVRVNDVAGSAESPLASDPPILPAMAVASDGTIYVAWNDYRNGRPGGTANGDFDILFSRSTDGGATWSPALRVNDDATAARQWMPDLALDPDGGVHVAWMDDRTGGHNVYYANSSDGGQTFGPNVRVTTAETPLSFDRPGDYLAIETDRDGAVYIVWTDGRGADLDIYFAKLESTVSYTIDTAPTGLSVEVDGQTYTAPATFAWRPGANYTVAAPGPQAVTARTRMAFVSWSDGGARSHTIPVGDAPATITATFRTEHEAVVRTDPAALEVLVDGTPATGRTSHWWVEGSGHTLAPTSPQPLAPGARYAFARWGDGGPPTRTVVADGPADYVAAFQLQYLLAVASAHGTPTGAGWYDQGVVAAVEVPALVAGGPGTRYAFTGWSGDSTDMTPAAGVLMNGPKAVTGLWRTEHLLTVESVYGTPRGEGWYAEGDVAFVEVEGTVRANGPTYRFAGWTGDATGTSASMAVAMDGPKTLTATWEEVPLSGLVNALLDVWPWLLLLAASILILVLFAWRRRRSRGTGIEQPSPPTR